MEYHDYYKTLEVARDASQDEIKKQYRRLARKYHPDVSKEANAEQLFKEVAEAYEVLKDPEKRSSFDQLGANWKAGQEFRPPPGWEQAFGGGAHFDGGMGGQRWLQRLLRIGIWDTVQKSRVIDKPLNDASIALLNRHESAREGEPTSPSLLLPL